MVACFWPCQSKPRRRLSLPGSTTHSSGTPGPTEGLGVGWGLATAAGRHASEHSATKTASSRRLLQIIPQLLRTRRVAQLAQRLRLNLPDALAGDAEALADLLQRPLVAVDQPEPELQNAPLPGGEGVEDVLDLVVEHGQRGGVGGGDRLLVLHEVAQVGVLLLADGRLQGDRVLGDLDDLAHLLRGDAHLLGDLVVTR